MWRRNCVPSPAQVRALDQAGHVRHHKGFLVRLFAHRDHAQVGSSVVKG